MKTENMTIDFRRAMIIKGPDGRLSMPTGSCRVGSPVVLGANSNLVLSATLREKIRQYGG